MASLRTLEYEKIRDLVRGFASSPLGRGVAGEMSPYWDADRANRALAETAELIGVLEAGESPGTGGFRDVRAHFDHLREYGRPLEPEELLDVKDLLAAAHRLRERFMHEDRPGGPRLRALVEPIRDLPELTAILERKLDPKLGVVDDASPRLARVRARLATVESFLRNRAEELARSERYRGILTGGRPVLRGGHYLLPVKADHMRQAEGILHDRSNTGQTAFIEPRELVPYSNERKDLKVREAREVQQVLWELSREVMARESRVLAVLRRVAWFDFTLAKARFARTFELGVPQVGGDVLRLRQARHPLLMVKAGAYRPAAHLETVEPADRFEVVPIDLRLGDDFGLLVITGPNTGGKTLALKTVGLLTVMALSGLPIPAAADSVIPDYRDVRADIGDEQSIEQSLSTFSAHVRRVIDILTQADCRTLVLLDELGAGTDPAEGAALGRAILTQLAERRVPAVVTTHLGGLKTLAYELPRVENGSVEFDAATLAPTYRLHVGLPGNSNALIIAERLGLSDEVLDRARAILARERDRDAERMIADLQATRLESERRRSASEAMLDEASRIRKDTLAEAECVDARRRELQEYADREVERQVRAARERLQPCLNTLRNAPRPFGEEAEALERALDEVLRATRLGERREAFIAGLRKGGDLLVPRLGVRGRVVRIDKKRRRIGVMVDGVRMDVPFDDVFPEA